jgi:hypothetical protein
MIVRTVPHRDERWHWERGNTGSVVVWCGLLVAAEGKEKNHTRTNRANGKQPVRGEQPSRREGCHVFTSKTVPAMASSCRPFA